MSQIKVIGVYPVEADEPVHLIELSVLGAQGVFKIEDITQEVPGQPRDNWQCPYMEQILSASGDEVLADDYDAPKRPELWRGDMRLAFFFHYLDFERPLRTPFGEVQLPAESELPERLSMLEYEPAMTTPPSPYERCQRFQRRIGLAMKRCVHVPHARLQMHTTPSAPPLAKVSPFGATASACTTSSWPKSVNISCRSPS
jgi:hypothetical protein